MNISAKLLHTFTGHSGPVYTLKTGAEENIFYSGSGDKLVSEWNLDPGISPRALINVNAIVYSICFIPERKLLLAGEAGGGLHVIDLEQRKEVRFITKHSAGIFDIRYSPLNNHVYTASADGTFAVWSLDNFDLLLSLELCKEKIRGLALSPEENELAIACGNGFLHFMDTKKLSIHKSVAAHSASVNTVIYHPGQDLIISGGKDAHLQIRDRYSHALLENIPAHNYAIYSLGFSSDGLFMASASRDKTVKIWDAEELDFLLRIDKEKQNGHAFSVNTILWSAKGHQLLSAGDDKTIKLWEIEKLDS